MKTSHAAAAVFSLATGCLARRMELTPEALANDVRTEQLQSTLWNLEHIAHQHGGNRAFGRPGYKASVDFVLERASERFGDKFDTYVQEFNHTYEEFFNITLTGPDGEDVFTVSPRFNPPTPAGAGGITARLVNTPVDRKLGSMCWEDQWDGIDAAGKIVLVRRGGCDAIVKVLFAKKKGAIGFVMTHHNWDNEKPMSRFWLSSTNPDMMMPTAIVSRPVGNAWAARLDAGEELVVTLAVNGILERRPSWNVISQTKQGDPDKVIMLGAHLDSVPAGPGINDDGSGTAALLEIMESVERYDGFPHAIRFAWWGAEEVGLVGSLFYTRTLETKDVDKIKYYFNYDMIGSPYPMFEVMGRLEDSSGGLFGNGGRLIGNGGALSGIGVDLLANYLADAGKEVTHAVFDGRSDYAGFDALGIPCVGLFTGEDVHDPCYHEACDNINNIDLDALTINTKAAAYALGVLANSLDGVPKRANTTVNMQRRNKMVDQFQTWDAISEEAQWVRTCSHGGQKLMV
ncbi:peptidase family M28 [Immersiella caudata]|uniref:Peptide hydrolase n=1 Tax=Immersiella caudata TaxID=314043 RepID=A0AA39WZB4_9PEZI|nr:peptidase family M28 [Immersiella caudata]